MNISAINVMNSFHIIMRIKERRSVTWWVISIL